MMQVEVSFGVDLQRAEGGSQGTGARVLPCDSFPGQGS